MLGMLDEGRCSLSLALLVFVNTEEECGLENKVHYLLISKFHY